MQGRLKLREAPPEPAELIAYARAELAGPKVSLNRVVPVFDPGALTDALTDSLGVRVVVEKARRLLRAPRRQARRLAEPPRRDTPRAQA